MEGEEAGTGQISVAASSKRQGTSIPTLRIARRLRRTMMTEALGRSSGAFALHQH